ncbi:sodium:proton antiporter [Sphingomonas sp. Leaf407]|uniref:Na+/H+ antiporter NhaA n=1 Tax=unclassified Sphingomonas TaxID=196159 RepID=UPI000700EB74|nr:MULTISPECIES: Na+/H+ antiporter NhaA [unclassified Sphingomonas]KQN37788.1 sodium:proton antiporter [Sphingomonas sp. Leaf42]KQT28155.1 sodium:proton antiporter [Sphingomonas sp. Leaf407]
MSSPSPSSRPRRATRAIRRFFAGQAAGGLVLLGAAVLALLVANSPAAPAYFAGLEAHVGPLSIRHWIDDGLMTLFFLLIGLEVKRELIAGQLSAWDQRILPGAAAVAGMAVPALLYSAINAGTPALRGWAIPAATDIAFALGIVALLGPRVPLSLKVLLTAIAVIDDLLAIVVIAVFYTESIAVVPLGLAIVGLTILLGFNRMGVRSLVPYLLVGAGVWVAVLLSGVHATLAGVAVALTIPLRGAGGTPPLERLEHAIQPWVAFAIVPLFGFANAGVSFAGTGPADLIAPLPLGIMAGLFLGKQAGIFATVWAMVHLGLTTMPDHAGWRQVWGMAALCGIGFTMSLFIGGLAFGEGPVMDAVRIGVLGGSLLSGLVGWAILARR